MDFFIYILERAREILSNEIFSIILLIIIAGLFFFIEWTKKQSQKAELKLQDDIKKLEEQLHKQVPDNIARQAVELNNSRGIIIDELTTKNKILETRNQELQTQFDGAKRQVFRLNLELMKQNEKNEDYLQYCSLCDPEDEFQDLALITRRNSLDYDVKPSKDKDKVLGFSVCDFCHGYHIWCGVCGEIISFGQERVEDDLRCDLCNTGFVFTPENDHNPAIIHIKIPK